jgi:hypothetical protein
VQTLLSADNLEININILVQDEEIVNKHIYQKYIPVFPEI